LFGFFRDRIKAKPRGIAVAAFPKLWIVSVRRAVLPEIEKTRT